MNHVEAHELISWSFFSSGVGSGANTFRKRIHRFSSVKKLIGLGVGVIGTVVLVLILWCSSWYAKPFQKHRYLNLVGSSRSSVLTYKELYKATKNFSPKEMLGTGGSGNVYRGCLDSTSSCFVAVKHLTHESKSTEAVFLAEISSLSQIRHRNVGQLQGWCHEDKHLLLVYDHMPNGSLNEWLHELGRNPRSCQVLSFKLWHSILEGVAAALQHLHEDGTHCILHRDIKSSNVLLDFDFKAHIGDFGLARLLDHHKVEKTTMAAGTFGYMAPEMPYTGKATKESDVCSFGILVLEVISGRRPLNMRAQEPEDIVLLNIVWQAYEARKLFTMADPRLVLQSLQTLQIDSLKTLTCNSTLATKHVDMSNLENNPNMDIEDDGEVEKRMVENLLHLGLLCCLPNPKTRPSMGHVNRLLVQMGAKSGSPVFMPLLPATKPLALFKCLEYSQTADVCSQGSGSYKGLQGMEPSS